MNRTKKRIIISILTFTALISSFLGIDAYACYRYWDTPIESNVARIYHIDDETAVQRKKEYDEGEKKTQEAIALKGTEELPEHIQSQIAEINKKLTHYFKEKVGIDVSKKLENLNVESFDFKGAELADIVGYFNNYSWENKVYISSELISEEFEIEQTYIHEAVHYLGGCQRGNGDLAYLYEGITEDLCNFEDIPYIDDSAYGLYKEVAKSLIEISPDIVSKIIEGEGSFELSGMLNNYFDENFATNLEFAMEDEADYEIEYLVSEFSKANSKKVELNLTKLFELKWMLIP